MKPASPQTFRNTPPRFQMNVLRLLFALLLKSANDVALTLARDNAGRSIPARIAMMAMTTRSSIRVNARPPRAECGAAGLNREHKFISR